MLLTISYLPPPDWLVPEMDILKREPAVALTCSIVYEIQSSRIILIKLAKRRPFIVFIICVRLYQSLNLAIVNLPLS